MDPFLALKNHITKRLGREPENIDRVLSCFESITARRGEHLLRSGDVCKYVYFIVEGAVQVYVIDKNGNESTREFYFEDFWVSDIFGFQNQTPSGEFIKMLEAGVLLRIHFNHFQQLAAEVPQFMQIYRKLLEVSYNNTVYRINTFTSMEALDRIKWLQEHRPAIFTRVSSRLIASYLGIKPETFTRLKSRL